MMAPMESFELILARHGFTPKEVQTSLGLSHEAVRLYRRGLRRVPVVHCQEINKKFGIPLHELRPDIWEPPAGATTKGVLQTT